MFSLDQDEVRGKEQGDTETSPSSTLLVMATAIRGTWRKAGEP